MSEKSTLDKLGLDKELRHIIEFVDSKKSCEYWENVAMVRLQIYIAKKLDLICKKLS